MLGRRLLIVILVLLAGAAVQSTGLAAPAPSAAAAAAGAAASRAHADATPITPTDYAERAHWLALPLKVTHRADVFYLYPTAYTRASPDAPGVSAVDDPGMMKGAQSAFSRQAAAFKTHADIYAPYYRQVDGTWSLSLPPAEHERVEKGEPTHDAVAAFDYYVRHFNHGRPFILAGHSQGSNVMLYLLEQYMPRHPKVYRRMIAAYVPGYSVTQDYLDRNHFRFARGATDTRVILSWNTEAETIAAANPVLLPGALAINPITWTRSETVASAAQNKGSIRLDPATGRPLLDERGHILRVMGLADARVDKAQGVVICSTVEPKAYDVGFPLGVYHTFDYPFYFFDVRANAEQRIQSYFARE